MSGHSDWDHRRPATTVTFTTRSVNPETGELTEKSTTRTIKPKIYHAEFVMIRQDTLLRVAKMRLAGETKDVLLYLIAVLDYENYLRLPQTKIAEELKMQKQNVNRSMKALIDAGVLQLGPKSGRSWTYKLALDFGWKGSIENWERAVNQSYKEAAKEAKTEKKEKQKKSAAIRKAEKKGLSVIESDKPSKTKK